MNYAENFYYLSKALISILPFLFKWLETEIVPSTLQILHSKENWNLGNWKFKSMKLKFDELKFGG
jgi:hypothetical protein